MRQTTLIQAWTKKISEIITYVFLIFVLGAVLSVQAVPLELWFDTPALDWEKESLPIGNGALGANVMGGVNVDVLQFAEKTLWTGGPSSQEGYDFGLPPASENYPQKLAAIQQKLTLKKQLSPESVAKTLGRNYQGYGSYQSFASVKMNFFHDENMVTDYRRTLDLNTAVATVSFNEKGVKYLRQYFVSYPDQVIVTRLSASQPGKINLRLTIDGPSNRTMNKAQSDDQMGVQGRLNDNGLQYASILQFRHSKGKVTRSKDSIEINQADEIWFTVAAATNYRQHYPDYRGEAALPKVQHTQSLLINTSFEEILDRHLGDYQHLFSRVSLDLQQENSSLPTPLLLKGYQSTNAAAQDRALETLYFQFGRYLLISSSRQGSLPANLQGVWNRYDQAPWSADYHVNINLQMNYWLANVTNLPETLPPLFDFIDNLVEPGQHTAKTLFDAGGWTLLLNTNIWGFTGLIAWPTAFWQPEAAAWMARHYYEHYLFTGDRNFLSKRAYPIMKGASDFWLDALQQDKQQRWVVSPSYSPEHGYFTAGAAMSQQIVFDLFSNTLQTAIELEDIDNQHRIKLMLDKLDPGLRIGSWGQLQEWQDDLDDKTSQHRHISQLYALYPGSQISPSTTPILAEAAKVTLNARGDEGTGWSKAWKINFWARLLDGNRAHKLLAEQLLHSTLSNLWDNHPPFQIDGNFGATAGIAEMLLQSHLNKIELLPALPRAWPEGKITGLKARGAVTVNLSWQDSLLQQASFLSQQTQVLKIKIARSDSKYSLNNSQGDVIALAVNEDAIQFNAQAGEVYTLQKLDKI